MIAVIGTVYTIPMLPAIAHTASVAIASIFITSINFMLDDMYNKTNTNDDPINESINVFVIVPIMSPPMFIPLLNNSFAVILAKFYISDKAADELLNV